MSDAFAGMEYLGCMIVAVCVLCAVVAFFLGAWLL